MERECVRVIETEYPDLVLDAGTSNFGEQYRNSMKNKQLKAMQLNIILRSACALLNSGGGIISLKLLNEDYDYRIDGIGSDIETGLGELVRGAANKSFFEFIQQGKTLLIFVQTWCSGIINGNEKLPQLTAIKSNAYKRSYSRTIQMTPLELENFLKRGTKPVGNSDNSEEDSDSSTEPVQKKRSLSPEYETIKSPQCMLDRTQFQYGEILGFTESRCVEFKEFSGDRFLERIKEVLPKCISAFANTNGGFLIIGVKDTERKVVGCGQFIEDPGCFEELISSTVQKLNTVHTCTTGKDIKYRLHVARVMEDSKQSSFLLILHVKQFCCGVFTDSPDCWKVENGQIKRIEPDEWTKTLLTTDPEMEELRMNFQKELSVSEAPPGCKSVFSIKDAGCLDKLQQQLFKVEFNSGRITVIPDHLSEELFKCYPALEKLLPKMKPAGGQGVLIFSRSWAVDIGLPKNWDVICDVLLVSTKSAPLLYTIVRQTSDEVFKYSKDTAFSIKDKLVNPGGYAGKLCVIPQIYLYRDRESVQGGNAPTVRLDNLQEAKRKLEVQYPRAYSSLKRNDIKALLRALTIVLLSFRSILSDQLGCDFLNLLTLEQFQILHSKHNIEKCKKLFVHGLPGTGKTIIAGQLIERIINTFHCKQDEVLYICENNPLKKFVSRNTNCTCVTRKSFMENIYTRVKHIVVDEAQNFRTEDGEWYSKAERLRKASDTHLNGPGVFWIFIDYFQMSHIFSNGLPRVEDQDPREELTRGVRNARKIHELVHLNMKKIIELPNNKMRRGFLTKLADAANCGHSLPGKVKKFQKTRKEIAEYIGDQIKHYLEAGNTTKQMAILCSTEENCSIYSTLLQQELKTLKLDFAKAGDFDHPLNTIILDSVRRFSGLEKPIIFGVNPVPHQTQRELTANILVCLASRAMTQLHVLYEK
ncbi:schlafen family member 13-like isoform X1 [Scyliorhinus torazame]|uniref:schlafen family member 13-like isoform X1 n=1 Tax=Scyliorhinus torazame TaxID=75743 RepID=UPI003B59F1AA